MNVEQIKYCRMNYSSEQAADGSQCYGFWYCHKTIKIVSDDGRPFSRGDIVEILDVVEDQSGSPVIHVSVVGDPTIDKLPIECDDAPVLLILRTRIFLNELSDYHVTSIVGATVLTQTCVVVDHNAAIALVVAVSREKSLVRMTDKLTGDQIEWVIAEQFSVEE